MAKLTQKEYLRIFKSISNLYGIAKNEEIDMIIDHYYENIDKEDTLLALKSLNEKRRKKGFRIEKLGEKGYMLVSDLLKDDEDVLRISLIAAKASFYFPPDKESFLAYERDFNCDDEEDALYSEFMRFLPSYSREEKDKDDKGVVAFFSALYIEAKIKSGCFDKCIYDILDDLGFEFKSKYSQKKLESILSKLLLGTRMFIHRGHKVIELGQEGAKMGELADNAITPQIGSEDNADEAEERITASKRNMA